MQVLRWISFALTYNLQNSVKVFILVLQYWADRLESTAPGHDLVLALRVSVDRCYIISTDAYTLANVTWKVAELSV